MFAQAGGQILKPAVLPDANEDILSSLLDIKIYLKKTKTRS